MIYFLPYLLVSLLFVEVRNWLRPLNVEYFVVKKNLNKFEIIDMRNNSAGNESVDVRIIHTSGLIVHV